MPGCLRRRSISHRRRQLKVRPANWRPSHPRLWGDHLAAARVDRRACAKGRPGTRQCRALRRSLVPVCRQIRDGMGKRPRRTVRPARRHAASTGILARFQYLRPTGRADRNSAATPSFVHSRRQAPSAPRAPPIRGAPGPQSRLVHRSLIRTTATLNRLGPDQVLAPHPRAVPPRLPPVCPSPARVTPILLRFPTRRSRSTPLGPAAPKRTSSLSSGSRDTSKNRMAPPTR